MTAYSRHLRRDTVLQSATYPRATRDLELRQQVREGRLPLDDYLRIWVGVHPDYLDQARPRFEREIFRR